MANQTDYILSQSYYFNPLTQLYDSKSNGKGYSVCIKLTTSTELPKKELNKIIQKLGNYMTLISLMNASEDTKNNYCIDYSTHAVTCDQVNWHYCKRHLTKEEIDECVVMKKDLDSLLPKEIKYEMSGINISRGEIKLMKRIFNCVRNVILNPSYYA